MARLQHHPFEEKCCNLFCTKCWEIWGEYIQSLPQTNKHYLLHGNHTLTAQDCRSSPKSYCPMQLESMIPIQLHTDIHTIQFTILSLMFKSPSSYCYPPFDLQIRPTELNGNPFYFTCISKTELFSLPPLFQFNFKSHPVGTRHFLSIGFKNHYPNKHYLLDGNHTLTAQDCIG